MNLVPSIVSSACRPHPPGCSTAGGFSLRDVVSNCYQRFVRISIHIFLPSTCWISVTKYVHYLSPISLHGELILTLHHVFVFGKYCLKTTVSDMIIPHQKSILISEMKDINVAIMKVNAKQLRIFDQDSDFTSFRNLNFFVWKASIFLFNLFLDK